MQISRRTLLNHSIAAAGTAGLALGSARAGVGEGVRRIAVEEGFSVPELIDAIDAYMAVHGDEEPGLRAMIGDGQYPRWPRLLDPEVRLRDMARSGVDMQVIMVNSPGVQIFEAAEATALARLINDRAAEWMARWPDRFAALAAIAPQDPEAAALELERAVGMGLKGAVINSHTKGHYLDERRFWPIFEAAQALDVPIYIHPREPAPPALPFYAAQGLEGAVWGYGAETSLHALRLIMGGVFEAFPRLRIVIGHDGEGIPFFLDRIDNRYRAIHQGTLGSLSRSPATIFRENFWVTTSGANWAPAVRLCQEVLGIDRVLFAVDYPFENEDTTVAQADAIPMTPEARAAFFHGNAERVFGLR
jgi:5-carboxyvanillate decarboxylase